MLKLRTTKGGGLTIRQIIIGPIVIGYTHNRSLWNGEKGFKLHLLRRKNTAL